MKMTDTSWREMDN